MNGPATFACILAAVVGGGSAAAQQDPEPTVVRVRGGQDAATRALEKISALVRGRCVDGATGVPLPGCRVELRCSGRRRVEDIPEALMRPGVVTTGDDGRFEVRVLADEEVQVSLEVAFDGCWPRTGRWRHLLPGEVEDVGTVALHPGVHAVGRVVDQDGRPVAGLPVGIDGLPLNLDAERDAGDPRDLTERLAENARSGIRRFHLHANKVRYGSTGDDGSFRTTDALPAGTHELRIRHRGLSVVEPTHITIPEDEPMEPVTIVVRRTSSISGVVVDESGQPVQGVSLIAAPLRSGRLMLAWSRADGAFEIFRGENAPDEVPLRVLDPGPCELPGPTAAMAWGTSGVRIELRRALSIELRVVEAGTDREIEDFGIRCFPTVGLQFNWFRRGLRLVGHHEHGVVTIGGVRRGRGRIVVVPKDLQLLPTVLDIVAVDGMERVRVQVERLVPMMVQVLGPDGQPVPSATVRVIVPGNAQDLTGERPIHVVRSDDLQAFSSDPNVTFDTEIYRATTDGGGTCIVYGIDGRDDLILGLQEGDGETYRIEDVSFGARHSSREVVLR